MKKILIAAMLIIALFFTGLLFEGEAKTKEKDIYALSYLAGYKCYKAMAGRVMMPDRFTFVNGYKSGFGEALLINIDNSAFKRGRQDAHNHYPSRYKEDILEDLFAEDEKT
jgi:hypothetical protein